MTKSNFFCATFFVLILSTNFLFGENGPTYSTIQDGSRMIEIECKQGSGTTILTCSIFEGNTTAPVIKEITVSGIQGKTLLVTPYHTMNDKTKLQFIEVIIREKMMAKAGTTVWLSPEMTILKQYSFNWAGNVSYGEPHTKAFLNSPALPCFPTDHGMGIVGGASSFESDSWLNAGTLVYLHYDFNAVNPLNGSERVLTTKKAATINSELYCLQADKDAVKKVWSVDIEEERILFYHSECIDGKIFLYTSYLKGNGPSKSEVFESRIRMIDGTSGQVLFSQLLDVKSGFELAVSFMFYDQEKASLYWAGNYVSLSTNPWAKNEGEISSMFAVGRISQDGKSSTYSMENPWTDSEVKTKQSSLPLLFVTTMGLTKSGNLFVAGVHGYWSGDCTGSNYAHGMEPTSAMSFLCYGAEAIYFNSNLEKLEVQQVTIPNSGIGQPVFAGASCTIQSCLYSYDIYLSGCRTRGRWDSETETIQLLHARTVAGLSATTRDYYMIVLKKGEKGSVSKIGDIGEDNRGIAPGFILDLHHCGLHLNRFSKEIEIVKI